MTKQRAFKTLGLSILTSSCLVVDTLCADDTDLFDLSLEQLMQIEVVSASRTADPAFTAPLSTYSLTADQISHSTATTIPELLRLIPGVLVTEKANGLYDVSLRAANAIPPGSAPVFSTDSSTLILVDNQPVYNSFYGGIYWPTVGVSLQEIDRIEVVSGPVSAMYGPNAANGVIHIITKDIYQESYSVKVAGNTLGNSDYDAELHLRYGGEKLAVKGFAQTLKRERTTPLYYGFENQQYEPAKDLLVVGTPLPLDALTPNAYPEPFNAQSVENLGLQGEYKWNEYNHSQSYNLACVKTNLKVSISEQSSSSNILKIIAPSIIKVLR